MELYIGIDPGKNGALAILGFDDPYVLQFAKYTLAELSQELRQIIEGHEAFALLEKVSSSPQMGVKSAFSFGQSVGGVEGVLAACLIPYERATPQTWQKAMKCMSGGDKNRTKKAASELFPHLKITHATADALLIAEYCRRQRAGK